MKTKAIVSLLMLACFDALAGDEHCSKVTVDVEGNRFASSPVVRASRIASAMFASTGVELEWRIAPSGVSAEGCRPPIVIRMTTGERLPSKPAALAYARAFASGGTSITVFWDQVQDVAGKSLRFQDDVLAHVLVHEITHVLQGLARHSDTGIMRDSWTDREYFEMKGKPLAFAPVDIEWIHRGLARRTELTSQARR